MSLFRIERDPTLRQLRQFGAIGAVLLVLIAYWQRQHPIAAGVPLALGAVTAACAWWRPRLLRWPFVWLSAVLYPLGLVVGEVILTGVWVLMFTPIALVFRVLRRDALERAFDESCDTYWRESPRPPGAESYFRQY